MHVHNKHQLLHQDYEEYGYSLYPRCGCGTQFDLYVHQQLEIDRHKVQLNLLAAYQENSVENATPLVSRSAGCNALQQHQEFGSEQSASISSPIDY